MEGSEDDTLPALEMEEGARSQVMWMASRSWERQGDRFFPLSLCRQRPQKETALPTPSS